MTTLLPPPDLRPAPPRRPWPWVIGVLVVVLVAAGIAAIAVRSGGDGGATATGAAAHPSTTGVPAPEGAPGAGPTASSTPTTVASDVPPAEKKVFDELMAQVADVRGLQWKGPLNLKVVSPDELARLVRETNDRDLKPDQVASEGEALKLLHLIPPDADLQQILDDVLAGAVLGFYDPTTKELYVGGEDLDVATKYTIAHEMTHALTDQVFDYGPATQALDDAGKTEESAAYSALLEGDAVLTQELWADKYLSEDEALEAFFGGGTSDSGAALALAPSYIVQALFFPYDEGLSFVEKLHDSGGYGAVNAAYRKPPTSTEQIIYPQTYLAGQGSPSPAIPDVAAATGCAPVRTGTVGEFDMRAVLSEALSKDDAGNAVEGWNGDTYGLVRCGSSLGLADRWDTDPGTDAGRLATALDQWAGSWSGSGKGPGADGRFAGSKGAGQIVRSGTHVDLVLAQDQATADRLVRALGCRSLDGASRRSYAAAGTGGAPGVPAMKLMWMPASCQRPPLRTSARVARSASGVGRPRKAPRATWRAVTTAASPWTRVWTSSRS